jgi:hypothetical protein
VTGQLLKIDGGWSVLSVSPEAKRDARALTLVGTMLAESQATYGASGSSATGVRFDLLEDQRKIFAMLVNGRLVVKLVGDVSTSWCVGRPASIGPRPSHERVARPRS